jgi:hypothetical protein
VVHRHPLRKLETGRLAAYKLTTSKKYGAFPNEADGCRLFKRKIAPLDILVASYNSKFQKRRSSAFLVYDKRDGVPEFSSRTKSTLPRITFREISHEN